MKEKDYRSSIAQITVPVSYFYAVPGSLFSPKLADWYRAQVRTPFETVAFEDSTHMLVSEYPKQFTREVLKVLENDVR